VVETLIPHFAKMDKNLQIFKS